jgi:hypothetical protein
VAAVLVTTRKATLPLELAAPVAVEVAGQTMQMVATELQTRAVVVVEQHPTGLLLSGGLAAQA